MAFANKHLAMKLYSSSGLDNSGLDSHRTRIALAEKGILFDVIEIDRCGGGSLEDLRELNPYQTVPTLIDRELVLHQSKIIMEYLEERFPYPPLLAVYPIMRAKFRMMIFQIENDWYPLIQIIQNNKASTAERERARKELRSHLITTIPVFNEYPYCLSEDFSLVDCSLAPILWRLPALGIELPKQAKPLLDYTNRVFARDAFRKSMTETESEYR